MAKLLSYRFVKHSSQLLSGKRPLNARSAEFVVRHGLEAARREAHRGRRNESSAAAAQRARVNENEARARGYW